MKNIRESILFISMRLFLRVIKLYRCRAIIWWWWSHRQCLVMSLRIKNKETIKILLKICTGRISRVIIWSIDRSRSSKTRGLTLINRHKLWGSRCNWCKVIMMMEEDRSIKQWEDVPRCLIRGQLIFHQKFTTI